MLFIDPRIKSGFFLSSKPYLIVSASAKPEGKLFVLLIVGVGSSYCAFGSLSVISPILRGIRIVFISFSYSDFIASISSNVPVRWFKSPGIAKSFPQTGLSAYLTFKQLAIIVFKSFEKCGAIGSYLPESTLL